MISCRPAQIADAADIHTLLLRIAGDIPLAVESLAQEEALYAALRKILAFGQSWVAVDSDRIMGFALVDAAEAGRIGLVNRVVPAAELSATTRALAERIAAGSPAVLRLAKHMLNRAAVSDLPAALDLEAYSQALSIPTEDHQEGLRAFFEKRAPKFTGQ